jgi:hypothetical protein
MQGHLDSVSRAVALVVVGHILALDKPKTTKCIVGLIINLLYVLFLLVVVFPVLELNINCVLAWVGILILAQVAATARA